MTSRSKCCLWPKHEDVGIGPEGVDSIAFKALINGEGSNEVWLGSGRGFDKYIKFFRI
jgi:hypothetical protein